jgi:hypothetical protein
MRNLKSKTIFIQGTIEKGNVVGQFWELHSAFFNVVCCVVFLRSSRKNPCPFVILLTLF